MIQIIFFLICKKGCKILKILSMQLVEDYKNKKNKGFIKQSGEKSYKD
jgi:hypothetical protein